MIVSIDQLVVTKENPRLTPASEASHKALVASIAAHGLIQPIVVRRLDDGSEKFEVIAGTRRLAAIREVGLHDVDVVENDSEYGVSELGTAENMMREAMHPLDEARVISRLIADGESMDAVAGRFGQTERWAEQRIRLNGLCKEVAEAFREGLIGMAAAQAYTLVEPKAQKHYFGKGDKGHQTDARSIASAFSRAAYDAKNALFALADYPAGAIRPDLFGEQVWLDDREVFDKLQKAAIERLKQNLLEEEGWGDVLILWAGNDYTISNKYVKAEGRILKADRSKYTVIVVYTPLSGAVTVDRGYVLRKEAKKIAPGKTPAADTTPAEEIEPKTADELSANQLAILGALQTAAIEKAIGDGDAHLALLTLLGPLLSRTGDCPAWCAGTPHVINYIGINAMLTTKLEVLDDTEASYGLGSREGVEKIAKIPGLERLLCNTALRSMRLMPVPTKAAAKALKAAGVPWLRFDEGFLGRYRLDALVDLADRLKVVGEGMKKTDLIARIVEASAGRDLARVLKLDLA